MSKIDEADVLRSMIEVTKARQLEEITEGRRRFWQDRIDALRSAIAALEPENDDD